MASAEDWQMMAVCDIVDLNDDPIAGRALQIGLRLGARRSAWPA